MLVYFVLCLLFFINIDVRRNASSQLLDNYNPKLFVKCFDELGCVDVNEKWYHPVHRPINMEPLDRNFIQTDFILLKYNKSPCSSVTLLYEKFVPTKESMRAVGFCERISTVIVIHDFTSHGYTGWIKHLAEVILRKEPRNVISVDWQKGAEPPLDQAVANARVVALEIGLLLNTMRDHYNLQYNSIYMIGHGLGAHIASYVGSKYQNISKITALDPTGPRFEGMPAEVRLHSGAASYVEVLHTDKYDSRSQGTNENWGHVDFFFNNVEQQPGCVDLKNYSDLIHLSRNELSQGEILPGCSHKRAFKYFIESLEQKGCTFLGIGCSNFNNFEKGLCSSCDEENSCITFGNKSYKINKTNNSYYLTTSIAAPYCMDAYSISIRLVNETSQKGFFEMILVDEDKNVCNASLADTDEDTREYTNSSSNTFVFFAPPPRLGVITEAKIKWTVKSNFMCFLLCKNSIHVEDVTIKMLVETGTTQSPSSRLCPLDNNNKEIISGTFATFINCDRQGGSPSVGGFGSNNPLGCPGPGVNSGKLPAHSEPVEKIVSEVNSSNDDQKTTTTTATITTQAVSEKTIAKLMPEQTMKLQQPITSTPVAIKNNKKLNAE